MKLLYEDNHVLVVVKPKNIPTQADSSTDLDFLTMLKQYRKEKEQKPGNVYLGLVHRLDRPVSGIMVFAKTSKAAKRLSEQLQTHELTKEYHAVLCGSPQKQDTLEDYLVKDTKTNRTTITDQAHGKLAILSYQVLSQKDHLSLVKIQLKTGRSHQIRVQFSSRGYPLWGDQRYNKKAGENEQIALIASALTFYHPITKEKLHFEISLPNTYPWTLF